MEKPSPHAVHSGLSRSRAENLSLVLGAIMAVLAIVHGAILLVPDWRSPLLVVMFAWVAFNVTLAAIDKTPQPAKGPYERPSVAVIVATRNGDAMALRAMLDSLDRQLPLLPGESGNPIVAVYVVENGTPGVGTEDAFRAWQSSTPIPRTEFVKRPLPDKREAHGVAIVRELEATITLTLDCYTVLEPDAVREGVKPFRDPEVMSVGGLLHGRNRDRNLLTRILDIHFVSPLVVERVAGSRFGAVTANRGGLAFYRTWVIRHYLVDYLSQTVRGRRVTSGDDRMLTGFAALEGKTVFRPQCSGTTLLPESLQHASDRQSRWWRSHWLGTFWAIRSFKPTSAIWLLTVFQTVAFIVQALAIPLLLVIDPVVNGYVPWAFATYLVVLGYVRSLMTLAIKRDGQSLKRQIAGFVLLCPLATLIDLWLGVALLWHGFLTQHKTDWQPHKVKVGV